MPALEPVTLQTERLLLRSFAAGDEEAVLAACADPEVQRWTTVPSPYQLSNARAFVERIVPDGWASGAAAIFAVTLDEAVVACVGLHLDRRADPAIGEIGCWCAGPARGRGVVPEAVGAVARWGFQELGLLRLEWYAEVGNTASQRAALRAGFTAEGVLRGFLPPTPAAVAGGADPTGRVDAWLGALLPE